ncbi:MAG: nicotinate phosphoribosyltransferase [Patescibacteria group bacterium]
MRFKPRRNDPLYGSLLETDFYQFTVGQLAFLRHPDVQTSFEFINRTSGERLADIIPIGALRDELDALRDLKFTPAELHYLNGTYEYNSRMFDPRYIKYLEGFRLPAYQLLVRDGQFALYFDGPWPEAMMWETFALGAVNALRNEVLTKDLSLTARKELEARARIKLCDKLRTIAGSDESLTLSDFGTRRAYSPKWQYEADEMCLEILGKRFRGTSNVHNAMRLGVTPMGTSSHQAPMIYSAVFWDGTKEGLIKSHRAFLDDWYELYDQGLSIFLPDTFGSKFFYDHVVDEERLRQWKGSRQDSGSPFEYAIEILARYRRYGIDPHDKLLVFSDGLTHEDIVKLYADFGQHIQVSFGWGTHLTNDFPGLKPISIVVKPVAANGRPVCKLSDNIQKATGTPETVQIYRELVEYDAAHMLSKPAEV